MKIKILFILAFITSAISVNAQIVNIPDVNFKTALLQHDPIIDTNGDEEIQVSEAENIFTAINVYNKDIDDLTGIEAFINIIELEVGLNNLTTLNVTQNQNLEILKFIHNDLSQIDLSQNTNLKEFVSNFNNFTTLDFSSTPNLEHLQASYINTLTSINVTNNPNLTRIFIGNTNVNTLDISQNENLTIVQTIDCPISTIDLTNNPLLDRILMSGTLLTSIDISQNPLLEYLILEESNLTEIDFSNNPSMFSFRVSNSNNLLYVNAKNGNNTNIVNFDALSCPNLAFVCVDDVDFAATSFDIPDMTTLSENCILNIIEGVVSFDANNDGCDSSDTTLNGALITTSNGAESFSTFVTNNGYYELPVNIGQFTTEISNLSTYFTSNPISHVSNFDDENQTDTANFCLESNGIFNDLSISVYPNFEVRPGFETSYTVVYANNGTTTLSGDITFEYNNEKLNFLSASEEISSQTSNELTFNFNDLNIFETRTIVLDFNVFPPPTTEIDDIINTVVSINPIEEDETPDNNIFELEQTVIGSYDPNDIRVLEGEEIFLSEKDDYLHYIIRFQNTGTASAINVRVNNILDSKLDWTSLQLESLSHPGVVEITNGNNIDFIFDEINLIDSATDEPNSHGYIAYKIKPKGNEVVVGDTFLNTADIFFDFNPAITTNTAVTTIIANLSIENFDTSSFLLYPNPAKDFVLVEFEDLDSAKLFIHDAQGRIIKSITGSGDNQLVNISELKTGIYFLSLEIDDKIINKRFIKK